MNEVGEVDVSWSVLLDKLCCERAAEGIRHREICVQLLRQLVEVDGGIIDLVEDDLWVFAEDNFDHCLCTIVRVSERIVRYGVRLKSATARADGHGAIS